MVRVRRNPLRSALGGRPQPSFLTLKGWGNWESAPWSLRAAGGRIALPSRGRKEDDQAVRTCSIMLSLLPSDWQLLSLGTSGGPLMGGGRGNGIDGMEEQNSDPTGRNVDGVVGACVMFQWFKDRHWQGLAFKYFCLFIHLLALSKNKTWALSMNIKMNSIEVEMFTLESRTCS